MGERCRGVNLKVNIKGEGSAVEEDGRVSKRKVAIQRRGNRKGREEEVSRTGRSMESGNEREVEEKLKGRVDCK